MRKLSDEALFDRRRKAYLAGRDFNPPPARPAKARKPESESPAATPTSTAGRGRNGHTIVVEGAHEYRTRDLIGVMGASQRTILRWANEGTNGLRILGRESAPRKDRRYRVKIIAPDGTEFQSLRQAADFAGLSPAGMLYVAKHGRRGWRYAEREIVFRASTRKRPVIAPDGERFESVCAAARAEDISDSAIWTRCKNQTFGWRFAK